MNVTDGRTDRHHITAYTALMHTHRAVKTLKQYSVIDDFTYASRYFSLTSKHKDDSVPD